MDLRVIEAKPYVPSRNFDESVRFYEDLGFDKAWVAPKLACFKHGTASFLLQDFYVKEHMENFVMHLLVENVDDWWRHIRDAGLSDRYRIRVDAPEDRPWGLRDFTLIDPSGVMWRIGQTLKRG